MRKNWIKRSVLLFFGAMIGFSILSRAADSLTVPHVTTDTVKSRSLKYELYGTGTVKENGSRFITVEGNQRIKKVWVKEGTAVKKGDKLFSYDTALLKELYEAADKEWKKQDLAYQKAAAEGKESGSANQKLDTLQKNKAGDAIETAREDLRQAKNAIKKKKKETLQARREEYETALRQRKKEEREAERKVSDAKEKTEEFREKGNLITESLLAYKEAVLSKNEARLEQTLTRLSEIYYGDAYKEHVKAVKEAEKALERAKEDWMYGGMDAEDRALKRAIRDAQDAYDTLTEEDAELKKLTDAYEYALNGTNEADKSIARDNCYRYIYEKQNIEEKDVERAAGDLKVAQEDYRTVCEDWAVKIEKLEEEMKKAEDEWEAIKNGGYDWEEELRTYRSAIEEAKKQLTELKLNEEKQDQQENAQNRTRALELQSLMLDLETADEKREEIAELLEKKGVVSSPADGIVIKQELEAGSMTSGQEKLLVAIKNYIFEAEVDAEEVGRFAEGDAIVLTKEGEQAKQKYEISYIQAANESNKKKIGVLLPEGKYLIGSNLSFQIQKDSSTFETCVPLTAIRKDNSGSFVLVIEERSGILGTEQYLRKVAVAVLEKDGSSAAVTGLSRDDEVVVSSNKIVQQDDRVRVYE